MEKYSRTYDLDGIKAAFRTVDDLRMTRTARQCSVAIGLSLEVTASMTAMTLRRIRSTKMPTRRLRWRQVRAVRLRLISMVRRVPSLARSPSGSTSRAVGARWRMTSASPCRR